MRTTDNNTQQTFAERRRQLLVALGWGSFVAFFGAIILATLRFFFPRVLYEPAAKFVADTPDDYAIGVDTRLKNAQRVWMIRTTEGMYALVAICTHLGCTPNWFNAEQRFKCPCHGSNFLRDGTNVAGPAPVPLFRAMIGLDLGGNLIVDKSRQENQPGKRDRPPFFLPLTAKQQAATREVAPG